MTLINDLAFLCLIFLICKMGILPQAFHLDVRRKVVTTCPVLRTVPCTQEAFTKLLLCCYLFPHWCLLPLPLPSSGFGTYLPFSAHLFQSVQSVLMESQVALVTKVFSSHWHWQCTPGEEARGCPLLGLILTSFHLGCLPWGLPQT